MAVVVRMPAVLAGASEATLSTWLVSAGATATAGDKLAEVETEKAVVEVPLEHSGVVGELLVDEGASVQVGTPIAVILASADEPYDASELAEPDAPAPPPAAQEPATTSNGAAGRLFASPLVRRLAKQHGIDLETLDGSGPHGRIVRRDLEAHLADRQDTPAPAPAPAPTAAVESAGGVQVPHTPMRRAIARRLTDSQSTVPHFYLRARCRVDELLALRTQVNQAQPVKVSVNDLVIRAIAAAHHAVPEANAIWTDEATVRFETVDVAVAVATDSGLVTPVVRDVAAKSVSALATEIADLADRARGGQLRQHELEGGSFTVSNLGMYGVEEFAAIINPPHAGILAVGAARPEPVAEDGTVVVRTMMTVTLSADHRVLDGAVGARWLTAFVTAIENPLALLV